MTLDPLAQALLAVAPAGELTGSPPRIHLPDGITLSAELIDDEGTVWVAAQRGPVVLIEAEPQKVRRYLLDAIDETLLVLRPQSGR